MLFAAIPAGNALHSQQIFRSDPKITEQRFQQNGSPSRSKISLSRTTVSETPKSSLVNVKACSKTLIEECHNEYSVVCEDIFTEREKYECETVEETKCEEEFTTKYEPACFQQILDNCKNVSIECIQKEMIG